MSIDLKRLADAISSGEFERHCNEEENKTSAAERQKADKDLDLYKRTRAYNEFASAIYGHIQSAEAKGKHSVWIGNIGDSHMGVDLRVESDLELISQIAKSMGFEAEYKLDWGPGDDPERYESVTVKWESLRARIDKEKVIREQERKDKRK